MLIEPRRLGPSIKVLKVAVVLGKGGRLRGG